MKTSILFCSIFAAVVLSAQAQYNIGWYKVAGGGGTSTGGVFSVSGTAGQLDASLALTGGSYSLVGGFWALTALQLPGSPLLTIRWTTTNTVLISWPSPSTGFNLEQKSSLSGSVLWNPVLQVPADNGTTKSVVINPPVGNAYYRLKY